MKEPCAIKMLYIILNLVVLFPHDNVYSTFSYEATIILYILIGYFKISFNEIKKHILGLYMFIED